MSSIIAKAPALARARKTAATVNKAAPIVAALERGRHQPQRGVKPMTFAEIKAKQEALWNRSRSELAFEIYKLVGDAEDNANDTIYVENAAPESDFEALAFGSLTDLIVSRDCSNKARAWFKRIGLKF